jgi:gamma-glutamyltranspeptidase/glutathione hydrolase
MKIRSVKSFLWCNIFCMSTIGYAYFASGPNASAAGADRPFGNPKTTRSAVMAPHGIVATSHTLAAQIGVDILKRGGNAVDAAIAVNAAMGVMEPMSCGIGGDLFAIVWDAKAKRLYGLNASGRSPQAATLEHYTETLGLESIPETGPLSWSVPGCVSGWQALRERFGTMPLSELLEPSITYAENGFPVVQIIGGYWSGAGKLLSQTEGGKRSYLKSDGSVPLVGELMKNADLARTYRKLVEHGESYFYKGSIAEDVVAHSESVGGLFAMCDFINHDVSWVDPVSSSYRGFDVWELPPNGQGIAALQILNVMEGYDVAGMGHNSADFIHRFVEAKKLAFSDRAKFYADPDVEKNLPIAELISKEYADLQRARICDRAALEVPAGDPKLMHGDTIYLTVVDKDRNAVSFIQSIYYGWGSGHVPGNLGFMLQNRGSLFALDPKHHNRLEPGKRPFHTIIPGMVTQNDKPVYSFGVMGGDMQPQGHAQVLMNMIDHGMDPQEAGDAARVRHAGSSTPTGDIMTDGGSVFLESGISEEVLKDLESRGHKVKYSKGAFGGYQAIQIDWDNGLLIGGSDPRKDGAAIGY